MFANVRCIGATSWTAPRYYYKNFFFLLCNNVPHCSIRMMFCWASWIHESQMQKMLDIFIFNDNKVVWFYAPLLSPQLLPFALNLPHSLVTSATTTSALLVSLWLPLKLTMVVAFEQTLVPTHYNCNTFSFFFIFIFQSCKPYFCCSFVFLPRVISSRWNELSAKTKPSTELIPGVYIAPKKFPRAKPFCSNAYTHKGDPLKWHFVYFNPVKAQQVYESTPFASVCWWSFAHLCGPLFAHNLKKKTM